MTSMTIIALLPSEVPTIQLATGSIATIRMMNGIERKKLTKTPSSRLSQGIGCSPPLSVTVSTTPSGRPMT